MNIYTSFLSFFLFFFSFITPLAAASPFKLEATLSTHAYPIFTQEECDKEKVFPGSSVAIETTITNLGPSTSKPGTVFVQFTFPSPLDKKEKTPLFQTEEVELPALAKGESKTILFKKKDTWPSILDFIRYDLGMRHYQTVVKIGEEKAVIGAIAYSFSATYKETPTQEIPHTFNN